ncbi:UDP-N-acetylmuramate dehydrogenase [Marinigracilibium pacificum]|uniref:UDP-N-acetylenolpyruvoylglucosamine reductase n=1 Tax=Marinigracilibium pacificum TaxID=2729599 RepID=A0A848J0M2_9BACT|nr:UDP-N-acetylmuramate dehydrogenase [Marinigracilibium pacificum]NMM49211.1 UDP-N-acetylmuramate dehydrogenase [Marinigracilibium pacificum]
MIDIKQNADLKNYHTFGVPAIAEQLVEVHSIEDIREALKYASEHKLELHVFGGGSNILFRNNPNGLTIVNKLTGIEVIKENNSEVELTVGAGEIWHEFVLSCLEKGYYGIENLSLIPGTVGAAPMQNIGAYGVEIKEVFKYLDAINKETGELERFSNEECHFGYRTSVFKTTQRDKYIIAKVTFKLSKIPNVNISYGAISGTLEKMGIDSPTPQDVSKAVIKIRSSKLPDPKQIGNAGSFFKNPSIEKALYSKLKEEYPEIPGYDQPDNTVKVPAGWLIEQCGWKGKKVGNTGSHKDQALVLVNYGNATGDEIFNLSEDILISVKNKFGINLEREVNVI